MSDQKPEFPPNCPYFRKSDRLMAFCFESNDCKDDYEVWHLSASIFPLEPQCRIIVAAVGESYWRKEKYRLSVILNHWRFIALGEAEVMNKNMDEFETTVGLEEKSRSQLLLWQQMNDPASPLWETFK